MPYGGLVDSLRTDILTCRFRTGELMKDPVQRVARNSYIMDFWSAEASAVVSRKLMTAVGTSLDNSQSLTCRILCHEEYLRYQAVFLAL